MRIFRGKLRVVDPGPADAGPEADAPRPVHIGPDRRGTPRQGSCVLRVTPQVNGIDAITRSESQSISRAIASLLRVDDRFCLFDDGSFIIVLAGTEDDHGRVVAQRLAVDLTLRSAAIKRRRRWIVKVAAYPYDERTEAVLADLAAADAEQNTA